MTAKPENQDWAQHYHAALLELDSRKLGERIKSADAAIRERLQASGPGTDGEYSALQDALRNLRVLQQEIGNSGTSSASPSHPHPEISGKYVVFVDANRCYVDVSDGVCSLLGYTRAELLHKSIDDVTAPELKESVPAAFQQYVNEGGMSGQFLLIARDGRRIPIRYESRVFPDGCMVARWDPLASAA